MKIGRKKRFFNDSWNSKLAAYSASASAALLMAHTDAEGQNSVHNITTSGSFTVNYASATKFTTQAFSAGIAHALYFWGHKSYGTDQHLDCIGIGARNGGKDFLAAVHTASGWTDLVKLAAGTAINGQRFVQGGSGNKLTPAAFSRTVSSTNPIQNLSWGQFKPVGSHTPAVGYIGFKNVSAGKTYYGWLRISVSEDSKGRPSRISLADNGGDGIYGAYDLLGNVSADHFTAGTAAEPVPEPGIASLGGLGLLAMGAAGLRELRRRRTMNSAVKP